MDSTTLIALLLACAPQVDVQTAQALVGVESAGNAHAIGVVGASLLRQPRSRAEALATARALSDQGLGYSVGLAQINVRNFSRLGLNLRSAFEPCSNLGAMQTLLVDCFDRAPAPGDTRQATQRRLRQALSCYYSGNYRTGFLHGYVDRVVRQVHLARPADPLATPLSPPFPANPKEST